MFLNETNPPLDEALAHHGIRGMRWGIRRRQQAPPAAPIHPVHDTNRDYYDEERHNAAKRNIALGALALAGTAATIAILHKNGTLKIPSLVANAQAERTRNLGYARDAYSKVKNKTFRPEHIGNPLFTRTPKTAKTGRDFIDAGFGTNGVFDVTTMTRGATRVNNFGPNVWSMPVRALPRGRT